MPPFFNGKPKKKEKEKVIPKEPEVNGCLKSKNEFLEAVKNHSKYRRDKVVLQMSNQVNRGTNNIVYQFELEEDEGDMMELSAKSGGKVALYPNEVTRTKSLAPSP